MKKPKTMKLIVLPFLLIVFSCNAQTIVPDQSINANFEFELEKYLGTWYEIARFDHSFERNLQEVTATYSIREDGKIKVVNQGVKNGKLKTAIGKARPQPNGTLRNLEVSFFWSFYAPYNILELDENYQYVLIGSNSPNYLWILSRTPQLDKTIFDLLIQMAEQRGYDTSKLIMVEQKDE